MIRSILHAIYAKFNKSKEETGQQPVQNVERKSLQLADIFALLSIGSYLVSNFLDSDDKAALRAVSKSTRTLVDNHVITKVWNEGDGMQLYFPVKFRAGSRPHWTGIKEVHLTLYEFKEEDIEYVIEAPWWDAVEDLILSGYTVLDSEKVWAQLAALDMPRLKKLSLRIVRPDYSPATWKILTSAPWWPQLEFLHLNVTAALVRELLNNKESFAALKSLRVEGNINTRLLSDMMAAPWAPGLESVEFEHCPSIQGGEDPIRWDFDLKPFASARLPNLKRLALFGSGVVTYGDIVNAPWFEQLEELDIFGGYINDYVNVQLLPKHMPMLKKLKFIAEDDDADFSDLVKKAPWARQLTFLHLNKRGGIHNQTGAMNRPYLSVLRGHSLQQLEVLMINTHCFSELLSGVQLPSLRQFSAVLEGNRETAAGWRSVALKQAFKLLAATSWFQRLEELRLDFEEVRHSSLQEFAQIFRDTPFTRLSSLSLINGGVDDAAIKALAAAPWFPSLKELELTCEDLGREGLEALCSNKYPFLRKLIFTIESEIVEREAFLLLSKLQAPGLKMLDLCGFREEKLAIQGIVALLVDAAWRDAIRWIKIPRHMLECAVLFIDDDSPSNKVRAP